jgi:polyisoprenyl-teichoic acid--peptidoglycan teichoic acid transferase
MAADQREAHVVRNILIGLAAMIVVSLGVVAVFAFSLSQSFNQKSEQIETAFPEETSRPVEPEGRAAAAQNILLLGSDTRGATGNDLESIRGQRSDTIMVAHIPASRDSLYVMSIMRDSWVEIPGHGEAKINAALSFGGVPLVVQTVEALIDARIDHIAIVDFESFKGMTEAVGGVEIENQVAFEARGYKFPAGIQKLNGEEALSYVRARYPFRDGDYQRVRNQQTYIKGLMSSVLSTDTLLNPGKLSALVDAVSPYLMVDEGLNAGYVAGLAFELRSVRPGDITFFTAPTTGTGTSADGQSIVNIDWDRIPELQEAFRTDTLHEYQPDAASAGG